MEMYELWIYTFGKLRIVVWHSETVIVSVNAAVIKNIHD